MAGPVQSEPTLQEQDFLARMSHELRTPLNAIQGYTDLLLEGKGTQHPDHHDLASIRRATHRLLAMVESVLDLSQLQKGQFEICVRQVDVRPLMDGVVQAISDRAESNGTVVRLDVEPLTIETDPRMFRQIIYNLADNAAKFTHKGRVLLRLQVVDQHWFRLVVSDNGRGMTNSQLATCMNPFWQADSSPTRQYDGAGVGLAVCRGLTELLGGRLEVKSRLGKGAEVTLTLPMKSQSASQWDEDEPTQFLR